MNPTVSTVVFGVLGGAASALGGWCFSELGNLHHRKKKLEERIEKLELKK